MLSYSKRFSIDLVGVIAKSCIISKVLSLTPTQNQDNYSIYGHIFNGKKH